MYKGEEGGRRWGGGLEGKEGKWNELGRGQAKRMSCTFMKKD